jgi:hypothetical protein
LLIRVHHYLLKPLFCYKTLLFPDKNRFSIFLSLKFWRLQKCKYVLFTSLHNFCLSHWLIIGKIMVRGKYTMKINVKLPFITIAASIVLLLPSVLLPWSLIDDGWDMLYSQSIYSGNLPGLLEWGVGRIRPAYWLARAIQAALLGQQAWLHHLARVAMFAACAWLVFAIARQLAPQNKKAALYAVVLFSFCPWGWEVWFRLGPQEGYIVLWSLIATYSLICSVSGSKIAYWIAVVSIALAVFSKEAAGVQGGLAVVLAWLLHREHPDWHGRIYALVALASALAVAGLVWALPKQGYAANYQLTISAIFTNAIAYLPAYLPYLPLLAVGMVGLALMPRRDIWPVYFLAWACVWLTVQLPWGFILPRYLLPSAVGLVISIGLLLGELPEQRLFRVFVPVSMVIFLSSSLITYLLFAPGYIAGENASAAIVNEISHARPNSVVYTDLPASDEHFVEMGIHLRWLYRRGDIQLMPIAPDNSAALDGWRLKTSSNPNNWELSR